MLGKEDAMVKKSITFGSHGCHGWLFVASSHATMVFNQSLPVAGIVYNDCTEEYVEFDGYVHIVVRATSSPNGHSSLKFHVNSEGIVGYGLDSGLMYRGKGARNLR